MGRLCACAESVAGAAKGVRVGEAEGGMTLDGDGVRGVVLAARDLAAGLLCEAGVGEVEALWRGWGGERGVENGGGVRVG